MSKSNKPVESKNIKVNKMEKQNKKPEASKVKQEEALLSSYKNTLVLGEISGKIPTWAEIIRLYGCEIFKRTLSPTEVVVLRDALGGFSQFLGAISGRIGEIQKEMPEQKAKSKK